MGKKSEKMKTKPKGNYLRTSCRGWRHECDRHILRAGGPGSFLQCLPSSSYFPPPRSPFHSCCPLPPDSLGWVSFHSSCCPPLGPTTRGFPALFTQLCLVLAMTRSATSTPPPGTTPPPLYLQRTIEPCQLQTSTGSVPFTFRWLRTP